MIWLLPALLACSLADDEAPAPPAAAPAPEAAEEGIVVIAWLDLSEPDGTARGSRSQAILLRGLVQQRPEVALDLRDVSSLSPGMRAARAAEWGLDPSQVDPAGSAFSEAPTVELRGGGALLRRWEGLAPVAELDAALAAAEAAGGICDETPLRRPFPGLAGARAASDKLWMADGEEPWRVGQPRTVQWLTRRPAPLRVGAGDGRWQQIQWEEVPAEEAKGVTGSDDPLWRARSTLVLQSPGCVEVPLSWGPFAARIVLQVQP